MLTDIAARVTTGMPWPGEPHETQRRPGRVLWLGSEDGLADMTRPRMTACGAMSERVIVIEGVLQNGKRNTFSLQDDLIEVCDWLDARSQ